METTMLYWGTGDLEVALYRVSGLETLFSKSMCEGLWPLAWIGGSWGRQEVRTKTLSGRAVKLDATGIGDAAWSVQSKDVSAALPKRRGEV